MKYEDAARDRILDDYNNPLVYTDPERVRNLPPRERMLAILNMAKTGQIVCGDEILTLEAMLANAGYEMTLDGHLSGEEMAALENFKRRLADEDFKEAAIELITIIAGAASVEELVLPEFGAKPEQPAPITAQRAAAKIVLGLTPFNDEI